MASPEIPLVVVVLFDLITVGLLAVLVLRKPRFETPSDLDARLRLLEQNVQAVVQGNARVQGASERVEGQIKAFTGEMASTFAASNRSLNEHLDRTLEEARKGRGELIEAFSTFEAKLERRISGFDTSLTARFETLQQVLSSRLEETGKALLAHMAQASADAANARVEMTRTLSAFRDELSSTLRSLAEETAKSRQSLADSATAFEARVQERFEALTQVARETLESLKQDVTKQLSLTSSTMKDQLELNGNQLRNLFATLQESVAQQLQAIAGGMQQSSDQLRATLNERLGAIQADNTAKLEEMRRTVDEKLHATLEQRLGASFKLVSEQLEQVHAGLGEMKNLAGSVGDLKRVMSNVRARGTWGEYQLGEIIEDLLTSDQYERNVKTVPGSNDLVEFAVRLPGRTDEAPVWLPIDSKFPVEDYQRLLDAHESVDKAQVAQAAGAFESSIRGQAKKIAAKYVSPPHTTDFAILFVPTEGIFAEIMRARGLAESVQNDYRVLVAGPSTLSALLTSLRVGFRTLAIERRSSEVWGILAGVKTEFKKFGDIVESTKKSIDAAANKFDILGRRTRAIERGLRSVQELPSGVGLVPLVGLAEEDDDLEEPELNGVESVEDAISNHASD
jgi:DNA recombination protein RmuC